jgi:hypothetical protein
LSHASRVIQDAAPTRRLVLRAGSTPLAARGQSDAIRALKSADRIPVFR